MFSREITDYLKSKDILEECSKPTKDFFNQNFGFKNRPVLIKDVANSWDAFSKWNSSFFRKHYGDKKVDARDVLSKDRKIKKFTLEDYLATALENIDGQEGKFPYYLIDCQIHLNTPLENDYIVPDYFKCWYRSIKSRKIRHILSWLYIGGANTFSNVHMDIWDTSAWNAVISGRKLWLFYDESQTDLLYEGKVNPFYPDYNRYPKLKDARPVVCIQKPGEIVFTPSKWWHAVYNIQSGISLTENFINATNIKNVMDNFKKRNNIKAIDSLKQIATENSYSRV
ncbi:cupin-like domain-containing protein [Flagellimonas meridianipacifica]|uniref:Cupin-like domain-containing protein n=1 Tax=Flagellimonas meridianipacifica TaxID=1080225 RepID=A0A2T0MFN3_9FLAO|nr:cupin-like domain-containing protein [Allomuricauda pacifica]PRX56390.1 Cupin-like domain-containing protein [Allomuricauda pacifica]